MMLFDTVAAISTPHGKGGVALIRISGERAIEIAAKVFCPTSGKELSELQHARLCHGGIYRKYGEKEIPCLGLATISRAA